MVTSGGTTPHTITVNQRLASPSLGSKYPSPAASPPPEEIDCLVMRTHEDKLRCMLTSMESFSTNCAFMFYVCTHFPCKLATLFPVEDVVTDCVKTKTSINLKSEVLSVASESNVPLVYPHFVSFIAQDAASFSLQTTLPQKNLKRSADPVPCRRKGKMLHSAPLAGWNEIQYTTLPQTRN